MNKSVFASKTNWGVFLMLIPTLLGLFGINVEAELVNDTSNFFTTLWEIGAAGLALYGRWKAKVSLSLTLPKIGGGSLNAHPIATIGAVFVAVLLLAGCQTYQSGVDKARSATGIAFTVYVTGYQPVLLAYSRLPYCGTPAVPPCRDRLLYAKLYAADGSAVACMRASANLLALAAAQEGIDLRPVYDCVTQVQQTKTVFKAGGLKPLVDDPKEG